MRLRVLLEPHHGATYEQILALAQAAEAGGFDAFFRSDHYLGIDADDTTYQPTDSWTTLAGLAVQTSTRPYRHAGERLHLPAARTAGGRGRHRGPDERRPRRARHRRRLVRARAPVLRHPVPAASASGSTGSRSSSRSSPGSGGTKPGERFSFEGKHYQLQDCASIPRPAARPKIIVGGAGAKRTPTLAAKYADEFNGALGMDVRERFENFRRICEDVVGRDPAEVRLSGTLPVCIGSSR